MNDTIPNTYYVLDNISTCPVAIPLKDYCRKNDSNNNFEKLAKEIQKEYAYIEQKDGQANEKIRLFFDANKWKMGNLR